MQIKLYCVQPKLRVVENGQNRQERLQLQPSCPLYVAGPPKGPIVSLIKFIMQKWRGWQAVTTKTLEVGVKLR